MNSEARFARSRIRAPVPALEEAGLSPARIADAGGASGPRPRSPGVGDRGGAGAGGAARRQACVLLDAKALAAAPREIGLRALAALLMAVSGAGLPAPIRGPGAAV